MAHKVFICHSSKDKLVADAACAALEAQRISCWIAPRDILAGEEYGKAIVEALGNCHIVLLIFSKLANDSPQVRREVERAVSKEKIIVPFRIEDILPSDAMEFALSNTHWLDALNPPLENKLNELCETIARLLKRHRPVEELWKTPKPPAQVVEVEQPQTEQRAPEDSWERVVEPVVVQTPIERPPVVDPPPPLPNPEPPPVDMVRTCVVCRKDYPVTYKHCAVDGGSLSEPHPRSQAVPVESILATISMWARPKVDMGVLNSMDAASTVVVQINGAEQIMTWGHRLFQVRAGTTRITAGIRHPFYSGLKCPAEMTITLQPNQAGYVRYTAGLTYFQNGNLEIDPAPKSVILSSPPQQRCCPTCRHVVSGTGLFCGRCGQRL